MKQLFAILSLLLLLSACSRSITMDQAANGGSKKGRSVK